MTVSFYYAVNLSIFLLHHFFTRSYIVKIEPVIYKIEPVIQDFLQSKIFYATLLLPDLVFLRSGDM